MEHEIDWDSLLQYIEEGSVIPIIGQELSVIEVAGRMIPLYQLIAQQLATVFNLSSAKIPPDITLNQVVCKILKKGIRREKIYPQIKIINDKIPLSLPQHLKKLAKIHHFNLFVSTAFDKLLELSINEERYSGRSETVTIPYSPKKGTDILQDIEACGQAIVYQLMGKVSSAPDYAVTDEDVLEFMHTLQSESKRPKHLFDLLNEQNLLIIGNQYPDWLARFFLRMTKNTKLSMPRDTTEYLIDTRSKGDGNLVHFLTHFSLCTEVYPESNPFKFIDLLYKKWQERNHTPIETDLQPNINLQASEEMPRDAIFISYASEDLDKASTLKSSLESKGFTVWLDKERLEPGHFFDTEIRKNIYRSSFFIPLISLHTEQRLEGYFRREWECAIDRMKGMDKSLKFILPIIIDGTPLCADDLRVPEGFKNLHWTRLSGGLPTPEFTDWLKMQDRLVQKRGRGYT